MSRDIYVLYLLLDGNRFAKGKAKFIVSPELPTDFDEVWDQLEKWMNDKTMVTIRSGINDGTNTVQDNKARICALGETREEIATEYDNQVLKQAEILRNKAAAKSTPESSRKRRSCAARLPSFQDQGESSDSFDIVTQKKIDPKPSSPRSIESGVHTLSQTNSGCSRSSSSASGSHNFMTDEDSLSLSPSGDSPTCSKDDSALDQTSTVFETVREATLAEIMSINNVGDSPSKRMKLLESENGLAKQVIAEREREIDYLKAQLELDAEERLAKKIAMSVMASLRNELGTVLHSNNNPSFTSAHQRVSSCNVDLQEKVPLYPGYNLMISKEDMAFIVNIGSKAPGVKSKLMLS